MKTIIVDDERGDIEQLKQAARGNEELDLVGEFTSADDALNFVKEGKENGERVDFALLDIEMPGMNGLELARRLREINPDMVIIFITGHDNYTLEAIKLKADFYLMKPYSSEEVRDCVERARLLSARGHKSITARTFGRFNLFIDGKLIEFGNAKAKELLALCIDHRGGDVTMEEAIDKLWEDREYDSRVKQRYRTTVMQLRNILKEKGAEELFESRRGMCHIDADKLECDYYDLLDGKEEAVKRFDDTYLLDYSWAEETLGTILRTLNR